MGSTEKEPEAETVGNDPALVRYFLSFRRDGGAIGWTEFCALDDRARRALDEASVTFNEEQAARLARAFALRDLEARRDAVLSEMARRAAGGA